MKAIRKAHEVECIQYNNNPHEVHEAYSEFIRRPVEVLNYPALIILKSGYYWDVVIYNNDWLVMSCNFSTDGVDVLTDKEFNEQYERLN